MAEWIDLGGLQWELSGWHPHSWEFLEAMETGAESKADIPAVPASVPGSVQEALRKAGIIPDWNYGLNARQCEWVENRDWIWQAHLPAGLKASGKTVKLVASGLDYAGHILINSARVGEFKGTFVPHTFDLTPHLTGDDDQLRIIFTESPRWLGQFGYTSQMTQWKTRFNYTWDWVSRLMQIGIWDKLFLQVTDGREITSLSVRTETDAANSKGTLHLSGTSAGGDEIRVLLKAKGTGETVLDRTVTAEDFAAGLALSDLDIELWQPNGVGKQPLYALEVSLLNDGEPLDVHPRTVGFKEVRWDSNLGAPEGAAPFLCVVNGNPLFLQGVNWTPIKPNFADVTREEYRQRIQTYRDLGLNVLRVWGGATLERTDFYELCDEMGLLVWQEFPLSSSGVDNWPPEDENSLVEMDRIVRTYIGRRQHHASLLLWCGGNELQGALDGGKVGIGKPVTLEHPMISRMNNLVNQLDPGRRFLPTSSSGPRFTAEAEDYGKGLHWDVHGPWGTADPVSKWEEYWKADDSLFRSESGSPGASPVDIQEAFSDGLPTFPTDANNPLWRRMNWWIEWPTFIALEGREPKDLAEYVSWSQKRQADLLRVAVTETKRRFPKVGGILLWMGHDCFPCPANTSILDFYGRPKPAGVAVGEVFRNPNP